MRNTLLALALAASLQASAQAVEHQPIAFVGSGNIPCAKYLEIRSQGMVGGMEPAMLPVIWMQGFLSGLNIERIRSGRSDLVFDIPGSADAVKKMMDQACQGRGDVKLAKIGSDLSEGSIKFSR